jgi:hypothetical protein
LWGIIPFGEGLVLSDMSLGVLYSFALSSLGVYGVLLAGWSANSKYAFLGSLRSTAAMISYELILSSAILIIILLTGKLNFISIIESQQAVWFIIPLLPVFIFYFISILAETSRTPFDLQEAKISLFRFGLSKLCYMLEHPKDSITRFIKPVKISKYVTMDNQQETKLYLFNIRVGSSEAIREALRR